jgi:hypothetical protein
MKFFNRNILVLNPGSDTVGLWCCTALGCKGMVATGWARHDPMDARGHVDVWCLSLTITCSRKCTTCEMSILYQLLCAICNYFHLLEIFFISCHGAPERLEQHPLTQRNMQTWTYITNLPRKRRVIKYLTERCIIWMRRDTSVTYIHSQYYELLPLLQIIRYFGFFRYIFLCTYT